MLELQIKDLCVGYNGKEILHNISLDIENGSFIAIVGPSGAGKSTLLKQINRLDPGKTGGSILWRGKDVDDYDVHELRRNLAYVFQKAVMFNGTTEENIKLSLKYGHEFKPDEIEALYQTDGLGRSKYLSRHLGYPCPGLIRRPATAGRNCSCTADGISCFAFR